MIQLVLILCAVLAGLLGIFVLMQNAQKTLNVLAAGINFCIAIWALGIVLFMDASTEPMATAYAQLYYLAAAVFVALLALFAKVFPNHTHLPRDKKYIILGAASVMAASIILLPNFIIDAVHVSETGNFIEINIPTYIIFSLYFIFFFFDGLFIIARSFMSSKKSMRVQAGLFLAGILSMSIPGFITNLLLPYFQDYRYIWVGPAMSMVFIAVLSYGIVRHGMFDVRLAAVRSTVYVLSIATLAFIYYLIVYTISNFLIQDFSAEQVVANTLIAIVIALLFQPIRHFFEKMTAKVFYRNSYNTDDFFAEINEVLVSHADLRSMLGQVSEIIQEAMHARQVYFYVFRRESDKRDVTAGTYGYIRMPKQDIVDITKYVMEYGDEMIARSYLNADQIHMKRLLTSNKIDIILPLMRDETVTGHLLIGQNKGGDYTPRDIRALRTVADELIIAVQNALSVEQVRDLNEHLQQRIDDATSELRRSNAQLQRLDEAKDEFVSMASHQLRTPLTSVKGYIDMVLQGDVGEINAMQRQLLGEAFNSSERMVHLINDFLNVSRLQTGKFIIEKVPTDMQRLVNEEVEALAVNARQRDMKFVTKFDKKIPQLLLDESKIRQVVMNFLDNSLYYSRENTKIAVGLKVVNDMLEMTVHDTGIGVPEKEQAHLFTKFFRATNARKQRPDGTGVGLFLAKKVIAAHGGQIIFESKEGEGSTFGFRLPIRKLQVKKVN